MSARAQEQTIRWSDLSGFSVSGTTLTKAAPDGWTASGISVQTFGGGDGYAEFGVLETNTLRVAGLSKLSIGGSFEEIDFGVRTLTNGSYEIVEKGAVKFAGGATAQGDRFRIALVGTSVEYRRNAIVVFTSASAVASSDRFQFAVSAFTQGAVVDNPVAGGAVAEGVVWTGQVNAAASGNALWKTTTTTAWDSEGLSTKAITSPDGYLEISASVSPTTAAVGLSNGGTSYALVFFDGTLQIFDGGTPRGPYGALLPTDKLRVSLEGGVVKYRKNGALFYTSTITPTYPLFVDTSLYSAGVILQGAVLSGTLVQVEVSRPTFSVGSGLYSLAQTVTITGEAGSTIRYTTNGMDPTPLDPAISSGSSVVIDVDTNLKAKAWTSGLLPSGTTAAIYKFGTATTEDVVWTGQVNAASSGNTLWKTTTTMAWDSEGLSTKAITSPDAYLEISASVSPTTAGVGLSNGDTSYGFVFFDGTLHIFEGSTQRGAYGASLPTDKLRVSLEGGVVKYRKNGALLYTSTIAPPYPLFVDASLYSAGAILQGAVLSGTLVDARPPVVITPASGTYETALSVQLSSVAPQATIRYTTDGSIPTSASPIYTTPIAVALGAPATIKAFATAPGYLQGAVATADYTFAAATPTITPNGGTYANSAIVTLATTTAGATIRYTLDGSDPTATSSLYTGPFGVGVSTTVKAKAFHATLSPSATVSAAFSIYVANPTISPASGTYVSSVTVTMDAISGASIYYTADGQDPTTLSTLYTAPFALTTSATVKAKAFISGAGPSGTVSAAYTIRVADPVLSPASGKWYTQHEVTVTTATPGATMYYTTDGTEPTESSALVPAGGQLLIDRSLSLRVRAFKAGALPSSTAHGSYLLTGQLAAGSQFSMALKTNGELWAWGGNYVGQIGDGGSTSTVRTSPVFVLSGVTQIAAGQLYAAALKADGTVWTWGDSASAPQKLGRTISPSTPSNLPGQVDLGGIPAIAIATGTSHMLAVLSNGEVRSWGVNSGGQLGRGNNTSSSTPVVVVTAGGGALSNVVFVAAGDNHSLALRADGTVVAWGANAYGSLGDGTTTNRSTATNITSLSGVRSISTLANTSYAIAGSTNDLKGWGENSGGQLGDGTTVNRTSPVLVASGVREAAAGASHTTFVGLDGRLWGLGRNAERQLGDATTTNRSSPVRSRMSRLVVTLGNGRNHSLAAVWDGSVWVTGFSPNGQLGLGNTLSPFLPTPVPVLPLANMSLFTLFDASDLQADVDNDGLSLLEEFMAGTDPLVADTNGNGMPDGPEYALGYDAAASDTDGDGLSNEAELLVGTNPFAADSDGDSFTDAVDQFPLDPTKHALTAIPGDTSAPVITLLKPSGATIIP